MNHIISPLDLMYKLYSKTSKNDKIAFLSGFFMCLITNVFLYTNTLFLHDSIQFFNPSTGVSNGRFSLGILSYLLNNQLNIPWVIGLISCMCIGFINLMICKIMHIKSPVFICISAGVITTCTTMILTNMYFSSVHLYLISCLSSLIAAYVLNKKHGVLYSVLLLIFSCSIYQAYLATAFAFMMGMLLIKIFEEDMTKKEIAKQFFKIIFTIGCSAILYYLLWKLILFVTGTQLVNYYAYSNLSLKNLTPIVIYERLLTSFFLGLRTIACVNIQKSLFITVISSAIFITCILFFIIYGKKKHHLIFTIFSLFSIIISVHMMYVISGTITHQLTTFAQVIIPIFVLYFIQNIKKENLKNISQYAVSLCLVLLIFVQFVQANALYTKISLNFDNTYSYATRLLDRIEQTDGFDVDTTKIVIVSGDKMTPIYKTNEGIDKRLKGDGIFNDFKKSTVITYPMTLKWFLQDEMNIGNEIMMGGQDYIDRMENNKPFPSKDSIVYDSANNEIIVKVADTTTTLISRVYWGQ